MLPEAVALGAETGNLGFWNPSGSQGWKSGNVGSV
jgi:hypothetical protein